MWFNKIYFFVLAILLKPAFCQKWLSPTDRVMYVENGKPLLTSWKVDLEGKTFFSANWFISDPDTNSDLTIVYVTKDNQIIPNQKEAESTTFGEVTIKKVDSGYMKQVRAEITYGTANVIKDTIFLKYVGYTPYFNSSSLQPQYEAIEKTDSSKNIEMKVVAKGDPQPSVFWTLNGKNVSDLSGFTVSESVQKEGSDYLVTSILKINELTAKDNGELKVVTKYGQMADDGPMDIKNATITVKYQPQNLVFSHNITGNIIYNKGHINLTCTAEANPNPHYTFKEGSAVLYSGEKSSYIAYLNEFHHTRQLKYICIANNSIGELSSNSLELQIINGTLLGKRVADKDVDWWVYFGVGVAIALLVFIGFSIMLCIIRRRIRSLNLRHDIDKAKMRQDQERRTLPRSNGANHIYDMNERGTRGTATQMPKIDQQLQAQKKNTRPQIPPYQNGGSEMNGAVNEGFDIAAYDSIRLK